MALSGLKGLRIKTAIASVTTNQRPKRSELLLQAYGCRSYRMAIVAMHVRKTTGATQIGTGFGHANGLMSTQAIKVTKTDNRNALVASAMLAKTAGRVALPRSLTSSKYADASGATADMNTNTR